MLAAYLSLLAFCNPVGLHMNYIRVTNTLQKWWEKEKRKDAEIPEGIRHLFIKLK
jgi:hypothetical protein